MKVMVTWGHRLVWLCVMKLFRNTVSLMGCWWELKWFGNNNPAKCDYDESDRGGDGCNTAIAITPGVWINEDDGNWNMLIATTRSSDYHPWSACAGHPTNKQTHPVGGGERSEREEKEEKENKWEDRGNRLLHPKSVGPDIDYNARLGLSETRLSSIILCPVCLFGVGFKADRR